MKNNARHQTKEKPLYGPSYFGNWADLIMPKLANMILPYINRISFITPTKVSVFAFFLFCLSCFFLFLDSAPLRIIAAILLPLSYIGDCLDGQLARTRNVASDIGGYLDKTIDYMKVYILMLTLSLVTYNHTDNILYIYLGFTAAFFFTFRYYIKYITIYMEIARDKEFLSKARMSIDKLYADTEVYYNKLSQTFSGRMKKAWLEHRSIFFVEESELIVFTAIAAVFNSFELLLWIFTISQLYIVAFRLIQRAHAIRSDRSLLLKPVNK